MVAFAYDVFLSYATADHDMVERLATDLRDAGLRVWLDVWEIRPGDSIPAKIEEGLESSAVLALCMSEHAFGSAWAALESHTFRFRDPLNRQRRFLPIRLDDAEPRGSLGQSHTSIGEHRPTLPSSRRSGPAGARAETRRTTAKPLRRRASAQRAACRPRLVLRSSRSAIQAECGPLRTVPTAPLP